MDAVSRRVPAAESIAALRLRGGLGGVDPTVVAKAATAISGVNAGVMYLSPSRAAQLYRATPSGLLYWMMELLSAAMLQVTWGAWLALGGTEVHRAIAWGGVPTTVQALKHLLDVDERIDIGHRFVSKVIPLLINLFLTSALFGHGVISPNLALQLTAVLNLLYGLMLRLTAEAVVRGANVPLPAEPPTAEIEMTRKFGLALLSSAVFCAAISFFGRGVHEALAYSMVVFMLGRLDGLFLSKGLERLGVAKTTTYGWLAVQVAVVAAILF